MQKATRQHTKEHNIRLVLRTIYAWGEVSRADVARSTALTPTTVSEIASGLIESGLVEERRQGESLGGKPPMMLSLIENANCVLGLDINSEGVSGALVNLRGQILKQAENQLNGQRGEEVLTVLFEIADKLLASEHPPILGIGVSTAGLVDVDQGIILQAVNLGWKNIPLADRLMARFGYPVYIANDSQSVTLAEYAYGERKGKPNMILIKSGSGVGAGILLNHQLHHGETFGAGEIGHLVIEPDGPLCSCGNRGCLEALAGRQALLASARQLGQNNPQSLLSTTPGIPDEGALAVLMDAALNNDPAAQQLARQAGACYGVCVASLVSILNIRTVMFTGDVTGLGPVFLEAAAEELANRTLASLSQETEMLFSPSGPGMALLGASALVLTEVLGLP